MTLRAWTLVVPALALALPAAGGSLSGRVSAEDGKGRPWVVYIERAGGPAWTGPAPAEPQEVAQKDMAFAPAALYVRAGTRVRFRNYDKIFHNVFSPTPGSEFDLGLYRGGVDKAQPMSEAGEVDVYCNIHPGMHARILVLPNRFYAEVAADGGYEIADVPPGQYTLVAWSARHESVRKSVQVADRRTTADFTLKARPFPMLPHLNKGGEGYGRYKN
jgi:plastocyanin